MKMHDGGTVVGVPLTISVIDDAGCVVPSYGVEIIRPRAMGKSASLLMFQQAVQLRPDDMLRVNIKPTKPRRSARQHLKGLRP